MPPTSLSEPIIPQKEKKVKRKFIGFFRVKIRETKEDGIRDIF